MGSQLTFTYTYNFGDYANNNFKNIHLVCIISYYKILIQMDIEVQFNG